MNAQAIERKLDSSAWPERAWLAGALALAAGLRVYDLGGESLWNDELATLHLIEHGLRSAVFWQAIQGDVHPPGYLLLMNAWCALFGSSDVALRWPSVLAGVGLCWAVYAFARRFLSPAIGVTAGYLAAVSPFLIEYSQEARSYSLVTLMLTWVARAWLELVAHPSPAHRARSAALAAVATATTCYLHYSGLIACCFIIALVFAYALAARRSALPVLAAAGAGAVALFLPWMPWFLAQLAKGGLTFLKPPALSAALTYPAKILPLYAWAAIVLLCALTLLRMPAKNTTTPERPLPLPVVIAFLLGWAVLTLAAFYVKSRISTPIFNDRNLIVIAPPLILLAAIAISAGTERVGLWLLPPIALVCAVTLYVLIADDEYYSRHDKEQFREVAQLVMQRFEGKPGVTIVALTYGNFYQSYLHRLGSRLTVTTVVSRSPRIAAAASAAWAAGAPRVLVLWGHIALKKDDRKQLLRDHRLIDEQSLRGAGYLLLGREGFNP